MILANVIIPSVVLHGIGLLFVLPVVVVLEGLVLKWRMKLDTGLALGSMAWANFVSTLVGIPLAWVLSLVSLAVVSLAADSVGVEPSGLPNPFLRTVLGSAIAIGFIHAMLPDVAFLLGAIIMLVPYYLITVRVEYRSLRKMLPWTDASRLLRTVWLINAVSYIMIYVVLLLLLSAEADRALVNVQQYRSQALSEMEIKWDRQRKERRNERPDEPPDEQAPPPPRGQRQDLTHRASGGRTVGL